MPEAPFPVESVTNPDSLGGAIRWHEIALQRWLNRCFFVTDGYPVPVVFTNPMDAYSQFTLLWKDEKNPFKYLLDLKDERGQPRYLPYPSPPYYPLISVHRTGWSPRASQSYGIHTHRRLAWATVNSDVKKSDLANVVQIRMPTAWDFKFQIDHICMRPETQSSFVTKLMTALSYFGGGPQTWIPAVYPGHWGTTTLRLLLDGGIQSATPDMPPNGEPVQFKTSFMVTIEGYCPEIDYRLVPALWSLVAQSSVKTLNPDELNSLYSVTTDLRQYGSNEILNSRQNIPADQ